MGQRQFNPSQKRHTSYIGLGISMLSKILARDTKTLCEYFPDVRSLILLQIVNRGCSLYVPATPHDEEVVKRACQVIEATDFLSRYTGKCEIPRIVVMTLPDIDHQTHNAPLNDERSRAIYLKQDEHIARIFNLYKSKGIFDRTLFVLCSDHGMEEVHNHLTIDNLMHDLWFEVYQSLKWVLMPQWGSFEANFWVGRRTLFDGPYSAVSLWGGNSDALVYIRGQRKDAEGRVVEESWDIRPHDEDLRAYHVGGTSVNIIQRLFDYSAGIGLIFTNPQRHVFNVYSRVGQAQILEREVGGMIEFQYTIVAGEDPLGYDKNAAIRPYIHAGVWLSDQQWVELTYLEHYPDALRRISYSFENPNSGHMHIVASDGWDFAPYYVTKHVLSGSHGSLNKHASLVPIMFHGPGIKTEELPSARIVDIVPTILKYFGVESPSVDGRALPVFEDDEKNRDIMTDPTNVFAKRHFQDRHYTYTLEHSYASYDRRIVRTHSLTGEREVLVESVREALPELRTRLDISLDLIGFRNGALIFRKTYATENRVGGIVAFDVTKCEFR